MRVSDSVTILALIVKFSLKLRLECKIFTSWWKIPQSASTISDYVVLFCRDILYHFTFRTDAPTFVSFLELLLHASLNIINLNTIKPILTLHWHTFRAVSPCSIFFQSILMYLSRSGLVCSWKNPKACMISCTTVPILSHPMPMEMVCSISPGSLPTLE